MSSAIIPSPCYGIMRTGEVRGATFCRAIFLMFKVMVAKGKYAMDVCILLLLVLRRCGFVSWSTIAAEARTLSLSFCLQCL